MDNYQQDHYQLISSFKLSERWTFNPTFHYTKGKGYYEEFKEGANLAAYNLPNVTIGGDTITSTDLVRRKWLDNHFYGVTYSFDYQSNKKLSANIGGAWNKYEGDHFGEVIWTKFAMTPSNDYRWYKNHSIKTDFNIFGKVFYQVTDKFNLFGDVQYRTVGYDMKGIADKLQDITRTTSFQFFNPKLGLNYQLNTQASFYASYAVGNKEPNRTDFVDNVAVPKAEHLEDLETGYRWANQTFNFDANFYYMNYKNQLVLTGQVNSVGEAIRVNVPKSYRAGIELVGNWKFAPKWRLNANATFSQNKINNFTETIVNYDGEADKVNKFSKTDISFSPNTIIGGQLSYSPVKNLEFAWLPKYVGKQYMDNTADENRKLNAFFVNDLRANYTINPKIVKEITFSALANNILNHLYESNGYTYSYIYDRTVITENFYYPQAGTNFLVAVKVRL